VGLRTSTEADINWRLPPAFAGIGPSLGDCGETTHTACCIWFWRPEYQLVASQFSQRVKPRARIGSSRRGNRAIRSPEWQRTLFAMFEK
jgi:hypothetical protein